MTGESYENLSQLGAAAELPESPEKAKLEAVPNNYPGEPYLPGVYFNLSGHRSARFRAHRHRLCARQTAC